MHKVVTLPAVNSFEYLCCRLAAGSRSDVIVLSVYRSGSKHITTAFFDEFTTLLEALATFRCPVLLLGDLNIHLERDGDTHTIMFNDLLESFDMCQQVTEPTHQDGGLLDVIVTRCSDRVTEIVLTEGGISDHRLISFRLPVTVLSSEYVQPEGRKWNDFSIDAFRDDLSASVLCCCDIDWMQQQTIDELFDIYNNELTKLLDKHAPRYNRKRKRRVLSPWFDSECRMQKRNVRRLERRYRKSRQPADRLAWVQKLKEQSAFYRQKECAYWSDRISSNAANPKRLWRDLDELMKNDDDPPAVSRTESTQRAQQFMDFF